MKGAKAEQPVVPRAEPRTYYDLPVLKEPVWGWEIPAYFFTGGLAAGSALLAAGAALSDDRDGLRRLESVALGATVVSGALLVADLGVPSRFHHMLRVAKPTSPMSVGSWVLGAFAGAVAGATAASWVGAPRGLTSTTALAGAALAPVVATYTAVLLADTAVPAWHDARRSLPFLFASGAAASAGACGVLVLAPTSAGPALRLALAGVAGELVGSRLATATLDPVVAEAYETGRAARLSKVASALSAGGGAVVVAGRGRRAVRRVGAAMVLAGALVERYAIVEAGRQSARDPRATVMPQRERVQQAGVSPNA